MLLTLLIGSGVSVAGVRNPSFEETTTVYWPVQRVLPASWGHVDEKVCFNSYCSQSWKTDGTWSAALFSLMNRSVTRDRFQSFSQSQVDLTGIGAIKFDVDLTVRPYGGTFEHFRASFLVDGVPLWSQTVGGEYLDQEVNVAGLGAGPIVNGFPTGHTIELRITALEDSALGFGSAYWTLWDNIRLIEGQRTIKDDVELDPSTLNLASNGNWITCYIDLEEGYDVSAIKGTTVALNINGHDVPAYMGDQGWATDLANADNVADFNGDGILERMVKFDRAAVQALVQPGEVLVEIKGNLIDGTPFDGNTTIRVIDNKAKTQ
jgi:hypothetical protein